jgi:hypothetical protein
MFFTCKAAAQGGISISLAPEEETLATGEACSGIVSWT